MKLKEYIDNLSTIAKKDPDALVVFSSDEEGSHIGEVKMAPLLVLYDKENNYIEDEFPEDMRGKRMRGRLVKAVVIN